MEEDVLGDVSQPKRHRIRDEMDVMTPLGQGDAQFGCHDTASAVNGVAGDADLHSLSVCMGGAARCGST